MERKIIDVGHLANSADIYLYAAGLDVDEIIFSTNRLVTVVEIPNSEDLQLKVVISMRAGIDRIHSITFPLPVIKLVLEFNDSTIIDLTQSEEVVKMITFQVPVDVAKGVQITTRYQLDPSVFQGGNVKFDASTIKICAPAVRFGLLTNSDEQISVGNRDLDFVRDQVKTYKLT